MTLDTILFSVGLLAEAAALALVFFRRIFKPLPLFSIYLTWSILNDVGVSLLSRHLAAQALQIYFISTLIDSAFMFCVLIELSMSVLRPARNLLPRWSILVIAAVIGLSCAIIWPFAKSPGLAQTLPQFQIIIHLQLTFSVIRILFFLVLAASSQLFSIGWRDRELQIATGFGFYALASLSVAVVHMSHGPGNPALDRQFHLLDELVAASYVCSMLYWAVSFAQKIPERREFTPQMQKFLIAVAGNAREARVALSNSVSSKSGNR